MPSRRDVLGTLGLAGVSGLAGCSAGGGSDTPDATTDESTSTATTAMTTTAASSTASTTAGRGTTDDPTTTATPTARPPLTGSDATAGGRVLRQPSADEPGTVELWFENAGDRRLRVFTGAVAPLTDVWSDSPEGLLLLPDDRKHFSSQKGETPVRKRAGCWELIGDLVVNDIGYYHDLEPGGRLAEGYTVLAASDTTWCPSGATYRFDSSLSASVAVPTTVEGGYLGPRLSCRFAVSLGADGSVSNVTGEVVASDSDSQ